MEMIPTNSVSLPGPHSRRAWIRITALVLGALVILGVLGYVLLDFTPVGLWVEQGPGIASMPSELKAATFVADSHNGPSVLYRVQSHAFVRETPSGTLISAEQEKTGPVQILHTTAGYSIVVGGTT